MSYSVYCGLVSVAMFSSGSDRSVCMVVATRKTTARRATALRRNLVQLMTLVFGNSSF